MDASSLLSGSGPISAPYGSWLSPITSDLIVAATINIADVLMDGDAIYWIEGRPQEAGRYVLVRNVPDAAPVDVIPPPFNARTRVHEYGGGGVCLADGVTYFSNFKDQRLYRMAPGQSPSPLSPAPPADTPDAGLRYADGFIDRERHLWIGVREDHRDPTNPPINTLVSFDVNTGGAGSVLVSGNDFYSSPRLSPKGDRLAWLTWNHPNMPWVGTELWVGDFDGTRIQNATRVAGGSAESVFQPEWSPDGRLYFISDRTGWWNLYRAEPGGGVTNLCPKAAEFGQPQWVFGMSTYALLSASRLVCAYTEGGLGKLACLDLNTGQLTPLNLPFTEYSSLRAGGGMVVCRAGGPAHPPAVLVVNPGTGETRVLRKATDVADTPIARYFSTPKPVKFPTTGDQSAFGLYYPPANPDYTATPGEKPPLVILCHGGPTAAASSTLDLRTQFWTSRGIAVMDVDYSGSTGYGRAYRERLHLQWGIADVDDCVAAVRYLAEQGLADPNRAVITGGSAGGFTTLACLVFRQCFRAGASLYGVSDLKALVRDTHKFESRYLDWLIGPYPAAAATYEERSPVNHAEKLTVPVSFFQGTEDQIVPPSQTALMVDALREKSVPVAFLLFAGEQHGFRQAANIKRTLDGQLYFFATLAFQVELRF